MIFDYCFISNVAAVCDAKDSGETVKSIAKGKISTVGERWIDLHRSVTFKSYENIEREIASNNDIGVFHELGEMLFSEEIEIINSVTNCGMFALPRDRVRIPENQRVPAKSRWKPGRNDTLLIVEMDSTKFLPLCYSGIGMVLDVWRHGDTLGFCSMISCGTNIRIGGISENKMYFSFEHTTGNCIANASLHQSRRDAQAEKRYRRMKCDGLTYPIAPTRCGCAPSTLVLCSRDLDDATAIVQEALSRYPSLDIYGEEIKTYDGILDDLLMAGSSGKRWNTKDIHIIKLCNIEKYDPEEYITRLRIFYSDEVSWRVPVPIRCISILQGDDVILPMNFRKEFGIRYVNQITNTGRVKAFITNKY